jgi:hypothetical protein
MPVNPTMSKPGINAARWNNGAMGTKTDRSWYMTIAGRGMPTENMRVGESKPGIGSGKVKEGFVSRDVLFFEPQRSRLKIP